MMNGKRRIVLDLNLESCDVVFVERERDQKRTRDRPENALMFRLLDGISRHVLTACICSRYASPFLIGKFFLHSKY